MGDTLTEPRRFDPHGASNVPRCRLPKGQVDYITRHFTTFIDDKTMEGVLEECPIPEGKVFEVPHMDGIIESLMEQYGISNEKGADKGLRSIQSRLMRVMGPLGALYALLEQARNDQCTELDFECVIELVEKTICCTGQVNVALNYNWRLATLCKLTKDLKKSKSLMRKHANVFSDTEAQLFGDGFLQVLKDMGKNRREAREVADALQPPKKKLKFVHKPTAQPNPPQSASFSRLMFKQLFRPVPSGGRQVSGGGYTGGLVSRGGLSQYKRGKR
ncbi:uncharacterized protein LOC124290991 [Haliotis rubra]|uniref:uncharacterized protein LOC124290991 n=1 Tax=Haliotis rubra TaxID=36100 RepID=UPI001EE5361D|nr:uncharacterized protein LOC124290991 [Haliotis rubra]